MLTNEKTRNRFMGYVIQSDTDSCWIWVGGLSTAGYGRFHIGPTKTYQATRLAWEYFNECEIPEGMHVCHKCDNPACVNPHHLFIGTVTDNMQDCKAKKRHTLGERNWKTRLTESDVIAIRRRYAEGGVSYKALAQQYGVQAAAIHKAVTRQNWSHVP